MKENLKKYLTEFIGTYFLVFTVISTLLFGVDGIVCAFAAGFALMICVYAGGYISGGHYNPAVSIAAAVRGALDLKQLIPYWISQVLGAVAAVYSVIAFVKIPDLTFCPFTPVQIIVGEFLFTFLLCYTVLHVATSAKTSGNSYFGFAIGSSVTLGALTVGGTMCFGAFNPAVALSLFATNLACPSAVMLTILTNIFAGIIAGLIFKITTVE